MKRFRVALLVVVGLAAAGGAGGVAPPRLSAAEPIKPAVEVRVKAARELVPILEYAGALFGQEDAGRQFAGLLKQFADDEKGYEGFDLKRPVGAYVGVAEAVEDSPVVLMIPVADEKAVLALLSEKLMLDPKKGDGGAYSVEVPGVPVSVHFRFANAHAYVTIRSEKGIDPAKLIAPKDFFAAQPDGFLSAVVHIDRWPKDIRDYVVTQLDHQLAENNKNLVATPVQQLLNDFLADVTVDEVKTALTDGDKFTVTLDVDPKADDWKFAVSLSAKPGTALDKTLAGFADRESAAAGMANASGPLGSLLLNFQLPPETTKKFAAVLDQVKKRAADDAMGNDKAGVELAANALLPTLKAGDFQLGVRTTPAAKDGGKFGLMVAVKTVDGKQIETLAKVASLGAPKDQLTFEGDVAEVSDRKLHKLTLKQEPEVPFALGTTWVLTSDDLAAVSADPKDDSLKALAAAKPSKTPMFMAEMSFARMAPFLEKGVKPEGVRKVMTEVFGETRPDGRDTLRAVARGGKKFELSVTMKGKAIALLASLEKEKQGE
jgi:hypothetical protein